MLIKALVNIINDFRPDIIYLPSFFDSHPDHQTVVKIMLAAGKETNLENCWLYGYEVWSPLPLANRLIDFSKDVETKRQALLCHRSQLDSRCYDEAILALNSYRGKIAGGGDFAEAFLACRWPLYRQLAKLAM